MNAVRLEDIAKKLGLSTSTVSRAISGRGRICEKTRQRVLEAVRESDYMVNAVARSLRMRDARNIGIVVPDISNSFFAAVIKGAQQTCRLHGYALMVCNSDESAELEEEALHTLLEKQISGLILASVGESTDLFAQCERCGVPLVLIDNIPEGAGACDAVSIDNETAARRLTCAMIERGYRDIGMISGPEKQSTGSLRRAGFLEALRGANLVPRSEWMLEGDFRMESGYNCMRRLLEGFPVPKAMIVANNYMAYGAINAIRAAGLRIPEDIAIAAFDTVDETGLITPLISSIDQPAQEIGLRASEIILARLAGKLAEEPVHIVLEPTITEGGSW